MDELKAIRDNWEILLALIAYVIWLVRLEGKVKSVSEARKGTQSDLDRLAQKHEGMESKVFDQLTAVRVSLAKIEGFHQAKDRGRVDYPAP